MAILSMDVLTMAPGLEERCAAAGLVGERRDLATARHALLAAEVDWAVGPLDAGDRRHARHVAPAPDGAVELCARQSHPGLLLALELFGCTFIARAMLLTLGLRLFLFDRRSVAQSVTLRPDHSVTLWPDRSVLRPARCATLRTSKGAAKWRTSHCATKCHPHG
eukprot:scaffold19039_cov72-Phaeocystis_antarctica.AAC.3